MSRSTEIAAPAPPPSWPLRGVKVALVALVVVGLALAYRFGVLERVADPKSFAANLVAMGAWGYLTFVVAYAILQPFGVPGTVFIVAAPLIWPWPIAFALSMVGTMAASVIGFSFARFIARDWVAARIPKRLRKWEAALEKRAFRTVVLLRIVLWMPPPLHFFFGVSKVRFSTHFWGSLVGYAPTLFLVSYLGAKMFDASGHFQVRALPWLGILLVVSLVAFLVSRRLEKKDAAVG
jgi:uncharacterized membrane protein YdjX (TVP38/TMEM64 family)